MNVVFVRVVALLMVHDVMVYLKTALRIIQVATLVYKEVAIVTHLILMMKMLQGFVAMQVKRETILIVHNMKDL